MLIFTAASLQQEKDIKRSAEYGRALAPTVPRLCQLLVSAHTSRHRTVMLPLHGLLQTDSNLLLPRALVWPDENQL